VTAAIAVVGMACCYPDAQSPLELWQMVLARRRAFRVMPDVRLDLEDYSPRDGNDSDSIYPIEAAVIADYQFDRSRFRVSEEAFASADTTHWLALDMASRALADAGLEDGNGLPRDDTAVIIGNTLTGEFSRAALLRHRWPYVRRVVRSVLNDAAVDEARIDSLLVALENRYKAPFPTPNSETLAGGLSNTIAGRICNHYNLRGGGFTVDGACAAAALAVISACTRLAAGEIDVAIAGAVDLSLDPFELIGFARNGALAPEQMRVFDARSNGFWPGEGCGMLVLMRRDDARAQGRRIYAAIRGWGMSTDGQGGLTRPTSDGQVLAMRRAYRAAGFGPESVVYFEGHGTGTTVGDRTELEAIAALRRNHTSASPASVGSIKANIGHTKAAAGLAGVINAAMALHTRIVPPIADCERPSPVFAATGGCLEPSTARIWPAESPLRAAVSSMGFGGINTHVVLEGEGDDRPVQLDSQVRRLVRAHQDTELFLFAADSREELAQQIRRVLARASGLTRAEMADAAGALATQLRQSSWRAAVVAKAPAALAQSLESLERAVQQGIDTHVDPNAGTFLGLARRAPRIVYLFPGQASPVYLDGGAWARRFGVLEALYRRAALSNRADTLSTEVAQVAITAASIGGFAVLNRLGLQAHAALGHSLGELTALRWAGALDTTTLLRVVRERGQAMLDHASPGAMAAIVGSREVVERLLEGTTASVACFNGRTEQVVSGSADEITRIVGRAERKGLSARRLNVSRAFHTPHMAAAVTPFSAAIAAERFAPLRRPVLSTVTAKSLGADIDLREHLATQIMHPVRFAEAVATAAQEADLFIEVGPGQVLSRLAASMTGIPAFAIDAGGSSLWGLLTTVGAAFVNGATLRVGPLVDRFLRPFDFERPRRFLANPCESVPRSAAPASAPVSEAPPEAAPASAQDRSTVEELRHLIARRLGLPVETIAPRHRLLGDLHLNSIQVGQLIAEAARVMGRSMPRTPLEFANVTVADAADALSDAGAANEATAKTPAGIDKWVRAFRVTYEPEPLRQLPARRAGSVSWTALVPHDHPLKGDLDLVCAADTDGTPGIIAALPPDPEPRHAAAVLAAAKRALTLPAGGKFVLLHHGGGGALARTLSLEAPQLAVCLVELPTTITGCAAWAVREAIEAQRGFVEARYEADGTRLIPGIELLDDVQPGEIRTSLGLDDVLLVTGGGKGIGAEAALALAQGTGARVAIMGRSDADDRELCANLARLRANGIVVCYRQADVTDSEAVRRAIESIVAEQGSITAFLHAAGVNQPARLASLDERLLMDTLSVKWAGARHVLAALESRALRLLIGFGSIIARTGLVGAAHYGLANEWLRREIGQFALSNPHCRCLCVEWSVWAGAGMGERLGVLERMAQQGIDAISIDSGTALLRRLVAGPRRETALIVAGRFGLPPTLRLEGSPLPLLRFIETPILHYPRIELVADSVLSSDTDPYLDDHALSGVSILPVVLAFEAVAQVASVLLGAIPRIIDGAVLREAITVPHGQKASIRIAALRRSNEHIDVAIRTASTQFMVDHQRCVVRAEGDEGKLQSGPQELEALVKRAALTESPLALDPDTDLYGRILFHGNRFQRIRSYRLLNARECVAEIAPTGDSRWFGEYQPGELLLGDPGARDAALHALQACVPHRRVLPVAVGRVELGRIATGAPLLVVARERHRTRNTYFYDLEIRDREGVIERWTRLELRSVEALERPVAWPAPLASSYIEQRVGELLGVSVHVGLVEGGDDRSTRRSAALAAAGIEADIHFRPDGKPELATVHERHVSISHTPELTLAVAARAETGCDIMLVSNLEVGWRHGLSTARVDLVRLLAERAVEELEVSAARVWAAEECLRKVRFQPEMPLLLDEIGEQGTVVLHAGNHRIVTLVEGIGRSAARCVVAISCKAVDPMATFGALSIEAVA